MKQGFRPIMDFTEDTFIHLEWATHTGRAVGDEYPDFARRLVPQIQQHFVACGVTKLKVEQIVAANWKYLFASILALMVLTYFPGITMLLPRLMAN